MAVLLGAALAIVAGAVVFLGWVALQAALLRALARQLAEVTIGWPAAAVAVVLASVAQSCGSSLLGGLDVGLLGFLVGLAAWSAVVSAIGGLPFEKAMLVGLAMAVPGAVVPVVAVVPAHRDRLRLLLRRGRSPRRRFRRGHRGAPFVDERQPCQCRYRRKCITWRVWKY